MSLTSSMMQNNWLADRIQVLLLIVIVVCLALSAWRYQSAVLVVGTYKADDDSSMSLTILQKDLQPLSFYQSLVEQKDIFTPTIASSTFAETQFLVAPASDLTSRYLVQGIVHDRNPMAIVKDLQTNKTYFLHRSEMMDDMRLVEIKENRLIFERNKENIELIKQ